MARTRTLTELIADVRNLADIEGATLRHTDARITSELNQTIQRFREWATEQGFGQYLVPYSTTVTAGATSPYAWRELDLSAISPNLTHVQAVEITVQGEVSDLDKVPFESRNEYLQRNGIPTAFIQYGYKIGILPPPDTTYAVTVWYLPVFANLVAGSDTFDGIAGWEEWLRWAVVPTIFTRDQYPQLVAQAETKAEQLRQEILTKIRGDRPSVTRRRDVRGNRTGYPVRRWRGIL